MTNLQDAEFEKLWSEVRVLAQRAAEEQNAKLGDERTRGFDCGFAWITMTGTLSFARWAKKRGLTSKSYPRGLMIWYSELHDVPTQSVSVHEAACRAASQALQRALGTREIGCGSRLD